MSGIENNFTARKHEIYTLKVNLAETNQQISEKNRQLSEKDQQLSNYQQHIQALEAQLAIYQSKEGLSP